LLASIDFEPMAIHLKFLSDSEKSVPDSTAQPHRQQALELCLDLHDMLLLSTLSESDKQ
jgi:hypothetical protein